MQNAVVTKLRSDFTAAISSDENDAMLDPSIASLLDKINGTDFLEPFSIYSRPSLPHLLGVLSELEDLYS